MTSKSSSSRPNILVVYYSFTNQTHRVSEVMIREFERLGCNATACRIELDDPRYRIQWPFKPLIPKFLRWFFPQVAGRVGKVKVPAEVLESEEYDLVCVGSPTWFLNPALPVSSFLKTPEAEQLLAGGKPFAVFTVCRKFWWNNLRVVKKLAKNRGGKFLDGAAFCFEGNQIQTALSCLGYFQTGKDQERVFGIRVYKFGIPEEGLDKAREFASRLVRMTVGASLSDKA